MLHLDKKKLLELLKNLNTKHQYSHLAQHILNMIVQKFSSADYIEPYKDNSKDLSNNLQMMEIYSEKHYERAERGLKKSYFVDYVLSQMTLQDDLVSMKEKDAVL